ncbi:hypothetical protein BH11PAT1_BH11PAT1_5430 [soil metagenome]
MKKQLRLMLLLSMLILGIQTFLPQVYADVACQRCSNNYGCTRANFRSDTAQCTNPINPPTYSVDLSCPKLTNIPPGGNNDNCPAPEYDCQRCSANYGCTMATFKSDSTQCINPINSPTYSQDLSCPKLTTIPPGGNNNNCPAILAPVITNYTLLPNPNTVGNSSTLDWSSTPGSTCKLEGDINQTGLPASNTMSTGVFSTANVYTYILTCSNAGGDSPPITKDINVTQPAIPEPTGLSATCNGADKVTMRWTDNPTYTYFVTVNGTEVPANDNNGKHKFDGTANTTYTWKVRAKQGSTYSPYAETTPPTITCGSTPPPPLGSVPFSQNPGLFFLDTTLTALKVGSGNHRGNLSAYNWLISSQPYSPGTKLTISYDQLFAAQKGATGNDPVNVNDIPTETGVYKIAASSPAFSGGPITIKNVTNNAKVILLVDGDVTIQREIKTPAGNVFILAASGNITIDPSIKASSNQCSSTNGQLQGIFSAGKNFTVGGSGQRGCDGTADLDGMLIINGTVIANAFRGGGSFINSRDLCEANLSFPAVSITARPDFILNLPDFAKKQSRVYKEVTP